MEKQDFTTSFAVDQSPMEVYEAINNVRAWWSGEIEGSTDKLGDEFTYRHKEYHYSKHKLVELIPGKRVVWEIPEASINFVEDKNEWNGTRIVFDITEKDGKTQVRFTHQGLVPENECFDACSGAWTGYVTQSLRNLVIAGKRQTEAVKN